MDRAWTCHTWAFLVTGMTVRLSIVSMGSLIVLLVVILAPCHYWRTKIQALNIMAAWSQTLMATRQLTIRRLLFRVTRMPYIMKSAWSIIYCAISATSKLIFLMVRAIKLRLSAVPPIRRRPIMMLIRRSTSTTMLQRGMAPIMINVMATSRRLMMAVILIVFPVYRKAATNVKCLMCLSSSTLRRRQFVMSLCQPKRKMGKPSIIWQLKPRMIWVVLMPPRALKLQLMKWRILMLPLPMLGQRLMGTPKLKRHYLMNRPKHLAMATIRLSCTWLIMHPMPLIKMPAFRSRGLHRLI